MAEIKLPLMRDIRKAIELFEDNFYGNASGYHGTTATNVVYSDTELDEDGDVGISFTGKITFDDHSETWHDCHVRFLTIKKYLEN